MRAKGPRGRIGGGIAVKHQIKATLQSQIFNVNIIIVSVTIILTLLGALWLTLSQNARAMDQNLLNSARVLARVPLLVEDLEKGETSRELWEFLDISTAQIKDIDIIAVADIHNTQFYYPDRSFIGQPFQGGVQQRILDGEGAFASDDTGVSGAERCAYAPVHGEDGTLLGFVMVGIYMRNVSQSVWFTVVSFLLIGMAAIWLGGLLSFQLSSRIKQALMGYEPEDISGLFRRREEILEALEEGIVAIDERAVIIYMNPAAAKMLDVSRKEAEGKPLHALFPASTLDRILEIKRVEHNIPLTFLQNEQILSARMPIWDDGEVVGAVAILRSRTEVTRLAKDLTGVRHMVEAMRAYTHEFMNKLHVILGLLQMGQAARAEEYIMDVTKIQQRAVGTIMESVEEPSVAALLVGKTSRCAELGIRMLLGKHSSLRAEHVIIPPDACVTVLGNLIENAIDALNRSVSVVKEITVNIHDGEETLFLSVEDTGPGMEAEVVKHIFKWGFSTKSEEHGTGLALVNEIVQAYGGDIRVESEPGIGTTFSVNFTRKQKGGSNLV